MNVVSEQFLALNRLVRVKHHQTKWGKSGNSFLGMEQVGKISWFERLPGIHEENSKEAPITEAG